MPLPAQLRPRSPWHVATGIAIACWLALVASLMVADVWDETNGMLVFGDQQTPLLAKVRTSLGESVGFWRPIPTVVLALLLHTMEHTEVSWRVLRSLNATLLLGSLWLLLRAAGMATPAGSARAVDADRGASPPPPPSGGLDPRLTFLVTMAFLFSGSALITAGWYANVYDAAVLLGLALGACLLLRGRAVAAGLVWGAGFFCKETAALAFPFLLLQWASGRVAGKEALRSAATAGALGLLYFALRGQLVELGSAADLHGFDPRRLGPTLLLLSESFWRQTLKGSGPTLVGFLWLPLSLVALGRPRAIAAGLALFAAAVVVYWGMFGQYQGPRLIHHLNFVGRLYLAPTALLLLALAQQRRGAVIAVLCIPILIGGATTWRDHRAFQETYRQVYELAETAEASTFTVYYPPKPLHDPVRGVEIGDLGQPMARIDVETGEVVPAGPQPQ